MTNNMEMTAINTGCKGKKIICVETGKTYPSIHKAAREFSVYPRSIQSALLKETRTCKGLHFRYAESETTIAHDDSAKEIVVSKPAIIKGKGKRLNGNTNAVLCITDGSIYTSCTDAAEHSDVTVGQMSHTCRNKGTHAKGKQYCYIKDIDLHLDEISDAISKKNLYTELLARENHRKEIKVRIAEHEANIKRLEDELASEYLALDNERKQLIEF